MIWPLPTEVEVADFCRPCAHDPHDPRGGAQCNVVAVY